MSKRIIPVIVVLIIASIFIAFKSQGSADNKNDDPKSKYAKILRNVGVLLEEGHYSPKKIDDAFSKDVFKEYLDNLDPDKKIFLQSDVDALQKYSTVIDNEIHGETLESFFAIYNAYTKAQDEVAHLYIDILNQPFDFNQDESLVLDPEKTSYSKTPEERKDQWRKYLKWITLDKYISLQAARDDAKAKPEIKAKADSTLQREAREAVSAQMLRFFTTQKTKQTSDYNFGNFVNTITTTMDPHSNYFPPIDLRTFNEGMKGSFFGIGAQLREEDGKIKIGTLITGMPAWKSGEVKEGDAIIKVAQGEGEPVDVTGYDVEDAVKLIRGTKGTVVNLTLRTIEGVDKVVKLKRDEIKLEDTFAQSAIINGKQKVGYIYLPEFYANFEDPKGARCAVDVAKEIVKLKAEKVDAIVLDLRGNGGGSLFDVVEMAGLFISEGPICQVKARGAQPQVLRDKNKSVLWEGPLAVMVDETSASASEIFAAAIQDYKRGIIIGSTSTYGKGTVQRNIPLNPESGNSIFDGGKDEPEDLGTVKLTLQKFYRINGDATQQRGVVPDIILPDRLEFLKIREKDNPNALKYDQIEKADYKTWTSTISTSPIVAQANMMANSDSTFVKIKNEARWIQDNMDKEYSLNITTYKKELEERKVAIKNIVELYKLPKNLNVTNITADVSEINRTKENKDRNKQFVKRVSEDIYINETMHVLDKVVAQGNLVKNQ